MFQVASEIARLQKRQTQLEESAKRPPEVDKEETSPQTAEPKHRDLWQIIYAESRVLTFFLFNYLFFLLDSLAFFKLFLASFLSFLLQLFFQKKAESARAVLDGICQIYDMPLYNQPSDTQVFQDNLKK